MKVTFRKVREKDLKRLNQMVNEGSVARFLSIIPPTDIRKTRNFYKLMKKDRHKWYCVVVDGVIAGQFSVHPKRSYGKQAHVSEFGLTISREYQGMGLGNKAIKQMFKVCREIGIRRVELEVVKENERAIKLYKKHGFVREGVKKGSFKINGRYHDTLMMAKWLN